MENYIVDEIENAAFSIDDDLAALIREATKVVYMAGVLDGSFDSSLKEEAENFFAKETFKEEKATFDA